MPEGTPYIIGLTGGVAAGKSLVAGILQRWGAEVIDADQLARSAVAPGSRGLEQVIAAFGTGILLQDGTLDRKKTASIVFSDPGRRALLESILHPEIRALAAAEIGRLAKKGVQILFYMAPLLIEAGTVAAVDEVWVVTVRPEVQIERLMLRDGIDREAALRIIGSQMPLDQKERYGSVVIDNSGTPEQTECGLKLIWEQRIRERL